MIQINPLQRYIDGGARAALTEPPSASLVFDLPGKAIWVKGVKLKGTDHTYTFSHDNYITLTNTPGSNESEDILIGVDITTLKNAIVNHNTDTKVSQILNSNNKNYSLLLKHTDNSTDETDTVNYASTLLYNPSTKLLKVDGNTVIHSGNITSNNPILSWGLTSTIGSILGTNFNVTMPNDPIAGWNIEVNKASFSITQLWEDSGIDLSTLLLGVCLLHINYQNVHYSGTFTYYGQSINTDDEILLHRSGYNSLNRGVIFAKIAPIDGTTKLLLAGTTPETSIPIFNIKIKQIAIL